MKRISESGLTTYHNHRIQPYFSQVKNGQKTIEGRLCKGWYCKVKTGDHVIVQSQDETDSFEVIVKKARRYGSLQEMLEHEPLEKLLPGVTTIEEGINIYNQFYNSGQQKDYGFVAIEVQKVNATHK